jgi:curved DNA-binding protein
MSAEPHVVLGVDPDATPREIRAAFRALALRVHPDRPGGDARAFAEARQAHDEMLARAQAPAPRGDGPIHLRFDLAIRLGRRRR